MVAAAAAQSASAEVEEHAWTSVTLLAQADGDGKLGVLRRADEVNAAPAALSALRRVMLVSSSSEALVSSRLAACSAALDARV